MTDTETASIVEFGEARAYADLFAAAGPDLARQFGLEVRRLGQAWLISAAAFDFPLFNRVIGLGLGEAAGEAQVDEALAHFARAGVRHFAVQLSPAAGPAELPGWLAARGLASSGNWVKMIRGPEPAAPVKTRLTVNVVTGPDADAFGATAAAGFGMPPILGEWLARLAGRRGWRLYLALDDGRPAGAGALYIEQSIGWLGVAATLPHARGQGGQSAIMARRIDDAAAAGCARLITETGEESPEAPNPSYHNMLRAGFRMAYPRPNLMKHN